MHIWLYRQRMFAYKALYEGFVRCGCLEHPVAVRVLDWIDWRMRQAWLDSMLRPW